MKWLPICLSFGGRCRFRRRVSHIKATTAYRNKIVMASIATVIAVCFRKAFFGILIFSHNGHPDVQLPPNAAHDAKGNSRNRMMRDVLVAACMAALLCAELGAADVAKDPGGWGDVKLGMTPEEVSKSLGTDGYIESTNPEPQPFNLDDTVDLPAAIAFAKEAIAISKKDPANASTQITDASKELLAQNRSATWPYAHYEGGGLSSPARYSKRRLSGTLEQITATGAKRTAAYARSLHIRSGGKVTQIPEKQLDDKSKVGLQKIEQAVADLASAIKQAEEQDKRDDGNQPIEASRIKAREVKIRGITLNPTFKFTDNRLTSISMSQAYAGENSANFDERGMQKTLCDALIEKYGPPDQNNQNAFSREYVWQFPTTVIRCISSRVSVPDSAIVRKGLRIVYEVPDAKAADSDDNL